MKNKDIESSDFELNRQIFHLALGVAIVLLLMYGFIDQNIILILIIAGFVISIASRTEKIPIIYNLLQKFEREKEIKTFPGKGTIFYFIGVYISLLLFPREIALASIMVLALGDSISHMYGLHYGKIKHPLSESKYLEGTIAGFLGGFAGALMFLPWHEAFFASLTAMVVEAIEIKIGTEQVDDNLIIPVVAGAVVYVIRIF